MNPETVNEEKKYGAYTQNGFFDESSMKQVTARYIAKFIHLNLETNKSTVRQNLIARGHHEINNSLTNKHQAQTKQAIIEWFERNGASKNQISVKHIENNWKIEYSPEPIQNDISGCPSEVK